MAGSDLLAQGADLFGVTTNFLLFHPAQPVPRSGPRKPNGFAAAQRDKFAHYLAKGQSWVRGGTAGKK